MCLGWRIREVGSSRGFRLIQGFVSRRAYVLGVISFHLS